MTQQDPITPPPELVAAWCRAADDNEPMFPQVAAKAAQWGADQELEACCEWLESVKYGDTFGTYTTKYVAANLRAARRPKPPSLKEQALAGLMKLEVDEPGYEGTYETIRRALDQLDD